jgi:DNA-binding transcriptional ArsR family regulator
MYEIIVRLSRAIASRPRLRILSHLAQHGETTPTMLQRELRLPLNVLSAHLRTLSSVGLISSRRSAARCHYDFRSPYPKNTLSGEMSSWLKELLRKATAKDSEPIREPRRRSSQAGGAGVHPVIFDAATAFTDLRRLQVLAYLQVHTRATGEVLVAQLKMSRFAVCRHTAKLRRRGMITAGRGGKRELTFQLSAQPKSATHGRMRDIIQAALRKAQLRTS